MSFGRLQKIANTHISQAVGLPAIDYGVFITVRGAPLTVLKVISVIHSSNFVNDMAMLTHLTVAIPFSQMRLTTSSADGDISVKLILRSGKRLAGRFSYRGVAINSRDHDMESPTMFLGESNDKSLALVTFELMDESMWFLRVRQVGGIYHNTDALTVARSILSDTLPTGATPEGQLLDLGYEEEEQQGYRDILIPDSEDFLSVFDFLQKHYGIYSKGLGVFLYMQRWSLFQPWDSKKFSSAKKKLVIINLPREMAAQLDRTCQISGNTIYLICGGEVTTSESKDEDALNKGTGYRVGSIRALDGRATSFSAGEVSTTTSADFVSQAAPNVFPGGVVNAPIDPAQHFTDTDKPQRSALAARNGTIAKTTWNRSTHGIITPGMAVKFMYANDYGVYSRYGTLMGEVFQSAQDGQTMASGRFNTQTELSLWLTEEKFTD